MEPRAAAAHSQSHRDVSVAWREVDAFELLRPMRRTTCRCRRSVSSRAARSSGRTGSRFATAACRTRIAKSKPAAGGSRRRSQRSGIGRGDCVAVMAPNVPALLEAHYAVPALGAILNPLNVRLDAAAIAFCLGHGGAKVLITDAEFAPIVKAALAQMADPPLVVDIDDSEGPRGERLGSVRYEDLLAEGDPAFAWPGPRTSGIRWRCCTRRAPPAIRKAWCITTAARISTLSATRSPSSSAPDSVYLWTLPMFHCCGWTYTWAVTAAGGDARLPAPGRPCGDLPDHPRRRVTHLCGAPIVLNLLVHAPASVKLRFDRWVDVATGGAAPPSAIIEAMEAMGFRVTHCTGLPSPTVPRRCARGRTHGRRCRSPRARRRWRDRACRCPRSRSSRSAIRPQARPCRATASRSAK